METFLTSYVKSMQNRIDFSSCYDTPLLRASINEPFPPRENYLLKIKRSSLARGICILSETRDGFTLAESREIRRDSRINLPQIDLSPIPRVSREVYFSRVSLPVTFPPASNISKFSRSRKQKLERSRGALGVCRRHID